MPVYAYKAIDNQGKVVQAEMEAESEIALTTELAKAGLQPIAIRIRQKSQPGLAMAFPALLPKKGVKTEALVMFTRQFATIIKAAVPIIEGLGVLAQQAEDPVLKEALNAVVHDVEGGSSLSKALARHPHVFSDLYVNTVVAGENAGILDKVLLKLSQVLAEDHETKSNIQAAMRYPTMVVFALLAAIFVLSVFVIPQFSKIYADAKMDLPLPTQIMIALSRIMLGPWAKSKVVALQLLWFGMLFGAGFLCSVALRVCINTRTGRWYWDTLKFQLPVVAPVYTKITMLRFTSMLNVLYQSGLPVLHTLDIVGATIGNVVLAKEVEKIKRDVGDGKGISAAVLNSPMFPRLVGYMISVGEKSGSLPMMLDSLYDYFYLEVKTAVRNLTTMIEPIMTAVLGSVVMVMTLAIFMPLWNLIQVIRQGT